MFDMHGECAPLCEGEHAIAQSFRVVGPGDLDAPDANSLFLPFWLLNRDEMLAMILDRSDDNASRSPSSASPRKGACTACPSWW